MSQNKRQAALELCIRVEAASLGDSSIGVPCLKVPPALAELRAHGSAVPASIVAQSKEIRAHQPLISNIGLVIYKSLFHIGQDK